MHMEKITYSMTISIKCKTTTTNLKVIKMMLGGNSNTVEGDSNDIEGDIN